MGHGHWPHQVSLNMHLSFPILPCIIRPKYMSLPNLEHTDKTCLLKKSDPSVCVLWVYSVRECKGSLMYSCMCAQSALFLLINVWHRTRIFFFCLAWTLSIPIDLFIYCYEHLKFPPVSREKEKLKKKVKSVVLLFFKNSLKTNTVHKQRSMPEGIKHTRKKLTLMISQELNVWKV